MKKIFFLFISLTSLVVANQGFAEEGKVTIVAVGEAEQEKDAISFAKFKEEAKLKEGEDKVVKELEELLSADFNFYRHMFEVDAGELPYSESPQFDKWEDKRYVATTRIYEKEEALWGEFKLYDVRSKTTLHASDEKIWTSNIRQFGHKIANDLYKAITGKDSIFETKIVFISDRTSRKNDPRKELYVMDFDGEKKQRITFKNSLIMSPAISPDNEKLVFSAIESRWRRSKDGTPQKVQNLNLYMYDLKTRKETVVSAVEGINSGAIFSADGENIYLTLSNLKNADIYKMNLKSGAKERITNHFLDDVDPHINRDGTLMTFLSGRSGKAMIYTLDPSGVEKEVKRISYVGKFNASPRFSPDGKEIVFASWVDDRFDIYKIDSSGNNLVRLTKDFGSNEEPWFSPDGQFIVFTSQRVINRKTAVQDIYIMNRDGEIIKKVTENYGKTYTPRWSNL